MPCRSRCIMDSFQLHQSKGRFGVLCVPKKKYFCNNCFRQRDDHCVLEHFTRPTKAYAIKEIGQSVPSNKSFNSPIPLI